MHFRRRSDAPKHDSYTSVPSPKSRRQSSPPKSQPAKADSTLLSTHDLGYAEIRSELAGTSPSATRRANVNVGMNRQRSRSDPEVRGAASRVAQGYGNGIGLGFGKKDSGTRDKVALAGSKTRSGDYGALELVDRMDAKPPTAIPVRKSAILSNLPTPTRIPGIASSKSRNVSANATTSRPSGSRPIKNSPSSRFKNLFSPRQTTPTPTPSPHYRPNLPSEPQPSTNNRSLGPPVPERPWIRGQGASQRKEKNEQRDDHVSQDDVCARKDNSNRERENFWERTPKTGTRSPLPITKPDPKPLLTELATLLQRENLEIGKEVDVDDVLAMHERDVMDRAGREEWIKRCSGNDLIEEEMEVLTVFGTPLRQVYIYASGRTVFGTSSGSMPGWELDLPIVVVSCIEEIWRRGAFDIELYTSSSRTENITHRESIIGSTSKFQHLVDRFNTQCTTYSPSPPSSCSHARYPNLSISGIPPSTEEIILLLRTYLSSLPEPIFSPALVGAAWTWCVFPSEESAEDRGRHVEVARILLRLLPSPNFAMLVYLLAFLRQVMRSANNGTDSTIGDSVRGCGEYRTDEEAARAVGKAFGKSIFSREDNGRRGEEMMVWFLLRWDQVCHGLFDVGVSSESRERPRVWVDQGRNPLSSKGTSDLAKTEPVGHSNISCLTTQPAPWMPHDAPGDFFGVSPSMDSSEDLLFGGRGELSVWADKYRSSVVDVHEYESAPLSCVGHHKIADTEDEESIVLTPCHRLFEVDTVSLMRTTPSPGPGFSTDADSTFAESARRFSGTLRPNGNDESKSICSFASAPALEQRLMDVSFPPASEVFLDIHFQGYENVLKSRPPKADSIFSSIVPSRASSRSTTPEHKSSQTTSTPAGDSAPGSPSSGPLKLSQAETKIRALKRELERSDTAVAESIRETFKARERIALLENRVKELELDADSNDALGASSGKMVRTLEEKLNSVTKERDEALELVKMVKQVMAGGRRS